VLAFAGASNADDLAFDLRIERGVVAENMRLIRVRQGDNVRLRWRSDRAILLHLHGYDIEKRVAPGSVAEMAFKAHATGRFPVEVHKHGAAAGGVHEEKPLVEIEVYPR
jgi:hypothetical protein